MHPLSYRSILFRCEFQGRRKEGLCQGNQSEISEGDKLAVTLQDHKRTDWTSSPHPDLGGKAGSFPPFKNQPLRQKSVTAVPVKSPNNPESLLTTRERSTSRCKNIARGHNSKSLQHVDTHRSCHQHLAHQVDNLDSRNRLEVPQISISRCEKDHAPSKRTPGYENRRIGRGKSPPKRLYNEFSFLKTLLENLPMESRGSTDSLGDSLSELVGRSDGRFTEDTPLSVRGGRKLSTGALGNLRESLKSAGRRDKSTASERMQRSRSASHMITSAATTEKGVFRHRLM
ncbi:hypothetical protein PoB_000372800 [Plakobranchus ocellatus]|uniref:Uncharacterized protein n=1 Tax=Plakobranchus ocellatus TaxID=259542 RepID=A0AAV3Y3S5_9GAST|nr:hypothetical protein PoB_000372800 [Plakobranchus ocellatus]